MNEVVDVLCPHACPVRKHARPVAVFMFIGTSHDKWSITVDFRLGWVDREKGFWVMESSHIRKTNHHFLPPAKRRKRKLTWGKCLSTFPSVFASSASSGSFMHSIWGQPRPKEWWPYTPPHACLTPTAAVQRCLHRGSGVPIGLKCILAWRPGAPFHLLLVWTFMMSILHIFPLNMDVEIAR